MKALLAVLLTWFALPAAGQSLLLESRPLPVRDYVRLERGRNSVLQADARPVRTASAFRLGPPVTFVLRQPRTTPRAQLRYFYSLPDSVVRVISLEIDSLNFPEPTYQASPPYREPLARQAAFAQYHQALVAELTAQLGPAATDAPADKTRPTISYAERLTTWATPALTAEVYSIFTTRATDVAPCRVRAVVSYKELAAPVAGRKERRRAGQGQ